MILLASWVADPGLMVTWDADTNCGRVDCFIALYIHVCVEVGCGFYASQGKVGRVGRKGWDRRRENGRKRGRLETGKEGPDSYMFL